MGTRPWHKPNFSSFASIIPAYFVSKLRSQYTCHRLDIAGYVICIFYFILGCDYFHLIALCWVKLITRKSLDWLSFYDFCPWHHHYLLGSCVWLQAEVFLELAGSLQTKGLQLAGSPFRNERKRAKALEIQYQAFVEAADASKYDMHQSSFSSLLLDEFLYSMSEQSLIVWFC